MTEATFAEDVVALLRAAWTDVFGADAGSPAMRLDTPFDGPANVTVLAPDGCAQISVTSLAHGVVVGVVGQDGRFELDPSDPGGLSRLRALAALAFAGDLREEQLVSEAGVLESVLSGPDGVLASYASSRSRSRTLRASATPRVISYAPYPRADAGSEVELPAGASLAWVDADGVARAFEPDWSTACDDRGGLDWVGLVERLERLEGEDVLLLVDDLGESRVTTIGGFRGLEGPRGTFAFAIATTVVTVYPPDVVTASRRDLGDGFWMIRLEVGRGRLLLASPDLISTDSEDHPRVRDPGR